jgi:protein SCO1/2
VNFPALIFGLFAAVAAARSPVSPAVSGERGAMTPAGRTPQQLREVRIEQKRDAQLPLRGAFRDESGAEHPLSEFFQSRPVVLAPVYYSCPMLCNQVLNGVLRASRALSLNAGQDYDIIAFSFDPRETPELARSKKSEYVAKYGRPGGASGWRFLTGSETSIRALTDAIGFHYTYDAKKNQFAHASAIVVLTPAGRVSRYFYGVEYSAKDLRLGLVEASAGKIGSAADQVLLYCFHYDPLTGRYSFAIMNVIRAAGIAFVLALGAFLVTMYRRESAWRQAR